MKVYLRILSGLYLAADVWGVYSLFKTLSSFSRLSLLGASLPWTVYFVFAMAAASVVLYILFPIFTFIGLNDNLRKLKLAHILSIAAMAMDILGEVFMLVVSQMNMQELYLQTGLDVSTSFSLGLLASFIIVTGLVRGEMSTQEYLAQNPIEKPKEAPVFTDKD